MSEFKGSKQKISISNANEVGILIGDLPNNRGVLSVWNNGNKEETKANAELIVEAFNVRQQIPFSLTELKRQRDEMVVVLSKVATFLKWQSEVDKGDGCIKAHDEIKQLLESATEIK